MNSPHWALHTLEPVTSFFLPMNPFEKENVVPMPVPPLRLKACDLPGFTGSQLGEEFLLQKESSLLSQPYLIQTRLDLRVDAGTS